MLVQNAHGQVSLQKVMDFLADFILAQPKNEEKPAFGPSCNQCCQGIRIPLKGAQFKDGMKGCGGLQGHAGGASACRGRNVDRGMEPVHQRSVARQNRDRLLGQLTAILGGDSKHSKQTDNYDQQPAARHIGP